MAPVGAIPAIHHTVREVTQASTGFSPFELLYVRQPRGVLDVLKEEWETPSPIEEAPTSYLQALRSKLRVSARLAQDL